MFPGLKTNEDEHTTPVPERFSEVEPALVCLFGKGRPGCRHHLKVISGYLLIKDSGVQIERRPDSRIEWEEITDKKVNRDLPWALPPSSQHAMQNGDVRDLLAGVELSPSGEQPLGDLGRGGNISKLEGPFE